MPTLKPEKYNSELDEKNLWASIFLKEKRLVFSETERLNIVT